MCTPFYNWATNHIQTDLNKQEINNIQGLKYTMANKETVINKTAKDYKTQHMKQETKE